MALFGKKPDAPRPRTPEERERARLEREARRRGEPPPPLEPPAPEPEPEPPAAAFEEPFEPPPELAPYEEPPTHAPASDPPQEPAPYEEPGAHAPAPELPPEPAPYEEPGAPEPPHMDAPGPHADPAAAFVEARDPDVDSSARHPDAPGPHAERHPDEWLDAELVHDPETASLTIEPLIEQPDAPDAAPAVAGETDDAAGRTVRRVSFHERFGGQGQPPTGRRRRPPATGGPRRRGWGVRVAGAGALVVAAVLVWFAVSLFQPFTGDGGAPVTVTIPHGATTSDIGTLLADEHVVSSSFFFKLRARLSGQRKEFKPGTYRLRSGASYATVIDQLAAGPPPPKLTKITISEGHSRWEVSKLLKQTSLHGSYYAQTRRSKLLDPRKYGAPRGTTSLEGFLFPATYDVRVGGSVRSLIDQQLETFKQRFATVDLRAAKRKHLTAYDVLIIASMVEREAALNRERPLIAAVIYNRLKQGMPLGIDATTRFATHNWTRPIRESELAKPGPYNTRLSTGLPPTPIGSPGIASIRAAAHPADVPYLYYVVKDFGCLSHAFSSTDAQFQQDVQRYTAGQASSKQRQHKSCK